MARPILETIRIILRNSIMWNRDIQDKLIELSLIVLRRPASTGYICKDDAIQITCGAKVFAQVSGCVLDG